MFPVFCLPIKKASELCKAHCFYPARNAYLNTKQLHLWNKALNYIISSAQPIAAISGWLTSTKPGVGWVWQHVLYAQRISSETQNDSAEALKRAKHAKKYKLSVTCTWVESLGSVLTNCFVKMFWNNITHLGQGDGASWQLQGLWLRTHQGIACVWRFSCSLRVCVGFTDKSLKEESRAGKFAYSSTFWGKTKAQTSQLAHNFA